MKIRWGARVAFLVESNGARIIAEPYTPEVIGFPSIVEPADIVIRNSGNDRSHCTAEMIPGNPLVIAATERQFHRRGVRFILSV
jgi:hypothetical protein